MGQVIRQRLANNIKILREEHHYKREELSLALGVDNSYISKLEKCRINVTIDKVEQIAEIFGVDPVKLISR